MFKNEIDRRKSTEDRVVQFNEVLKLLNTTLRHDLLNDITVAMNSIDMYEDKGDKKFLRNATRSLEKSVKLIEQIKELEYLISTGENLRPYKIKRIVEDVLSNYQVEYNIHGEECEVSADEGLSSIIDNLVRNAIFHGKADKIEVSIESEGDKCKVTFADNGTGIPADMREKVFEKGFSGGNGSGLGLYIARKTVERYGGRIDLESEEKGAVFVLRLNRAHYPA
ncbi:MAG: sensor histidine kinase [Halobacteriota archaeon]